MNTKLKIIVVILFLFLGYNIYEYCISIQGFQDYTADFNSAVYDINISASSSNKTSSSMGISQYTTDSGSVTDAVITGFKKTPNADISTEGTAADTATADFNNTPISGAPSQQTESKTAFDTTGLTLSSGGQIGGQVPNNGSNVDGVFEIVLTITPTGGSDPTYEKKYLKVKIIDTGVNAASLSCTGAERAFSTTSALTGDGREDNRTLCESAGGGSACEYKYKYNTEHCIMKTYTGDPSAPNSDVCSNAHTTPETACDKGDAQNAQSACQQMQAEKLRMANELEQIKNQGQLALEREQNKAESEKPGWLRGMEAAPGIIDSAGKLTPWGAMSTLIETGGEAAEGIFGGHQNSVAHLNTIFNTNVSQESVSQARNNCVQYTDNYMTNAVIVDTTSGQNQCSREALGMSQEAYDNAISSGIISPGTTVTDIDQSLNNITSQTCLFTSTTKLFSEGKDDVTRTAITKALSDLKGSGTINSSTDGCTESNTNVNVCNYLSSEQCCSNSQNDKMENVLDIKGGCIRANNINQAIDNSSSNTCSGVVGTDVTTLLTNRQDDTQRTSDSNTQSSQLAETTRNLMILGFIGLVFSVLCYLGYKKFISSGSSKNSGGNGDANS